jgi:hypothetical protein
VPVTPNEKKVKVNGILKSEVDTTSSSLVDMNTTTSLTEHIVMTQEKDKPTPGKPRYRPAHELMDGGLERCGRGLVQNLENAI